MRKLLLCVLVFLVLAAFVVAQDEAEAGAEAKPKSEKKPLPKIDESAYNMEIDYTRLKGIDITPDGYVLFKSGDTRFYYKADAFAPTKPFVIGLGPFQKQTVIRVHLKKIKGLVNVPARAVFEGMEKYEIIDKPGYARRGTEHEFYRLVEDRNELVLYDKLPAFAFLGNAFSDLTFGRTIEVNTYPLGHVTLYVPKDHKILDWAGANFSQKMNDSAVYASTYQNLSVVYVNEGFKTLVQLGLALFVLLLVVFMVKFYDKLPGLDFSTRHLLMAMAIGLLIMTQLGFMVPYKWPLVVSADEFLEFKGEKVPIYMRLVLGLTKAVDAIEVKSTRWCEDGIFSKAKGVFLNFKGAKKVFFPLEELEKDKAKWEKCIEMTKENVGAKKVEVLSKAEIAEKIGRMKEFKPLGFAYDKVRRIVFFLFVLIGGMLLAALALATFEFTETKKWLGFLAVAFFLPGFLAFANILVGFLAEIPVTYHGASALSLTMGTKAFPGFTQAHFLRLGIFAMAVLLLLIFNKKVRNKIDIRIFLLPLLVFSIFLTLPQTEFSTKKMLSSIVCDRCGVEYFGKLETFSVNELFKGLRGTEELSLFVDYADYSEYVAAEKLRVAKQHEEAIEAFEAFVTTFPESTHVPESYFKLAQIYQGQRDFKNAAKYYQLARDTSTDETAGRWLNDLLLEMYNKTNDLDGIIGVYRYRLEYSQESQKAELLKAIADINIKKNEFKEALRIYAQIVEDYPDSAAAGEASKEIVKIREKV